MAFILVIHSIFLIFWLTAQIAKMFTSSYQNAVTQTVVSAWKVALSSPNHFNLDGSLGLTYIISKIKSSPFLLLPAHHPIL